jgi:hypothetical protein
MTFNEPQTQLFLSDGNMTAQTRRSGEKKMKKLLPIFILIFVLAAYGQVKTHKPRTVYNKTRTRLIGIYGLVNCTGNGKRNFSGAMARIQAGESAYYFDIGKRSFELDFENLSIDDRFYLSPFMKKRNRVAIHACAGGSNGDWHVINIRRIK